MSPSPGIEWPDRHLCDGLGRRFLRRLRRRGWQEFCGRSCCGWLLLCHLRLLQVLLQVLVDHDDGLALLRLLDLVLRAANSAL